MRTEKVDGVTSLSVFIKCRKTLLKIQ